jgi:hypothetical protein
MRRAQSTSTRLRFVDPADDALRRGCSSLVATRGIFPALVRSGSDNACRSRTRHKRTRAERIDVAFASCSLGAPGVPIAVAEEKTGFRCVSRLRRRSCLSNVVETRPATTAHWAAALRIIGRGCHAAQDDSTRSPSGEGLRDSMRERSSLSRFTHSALVADPRRHASRGPSGRPMHPSRSLRRVFLARRRIDRPRLSISKF